MSKLILKHPIALGKGQLTELHLRDNVIAEDYLAFDSYGGVAQAIRLIANISGTDEAIVRKLHGADYQAAKRHVDAMLAECDLSKADAELPAAASTDAPLSETAKKP